jgi:hypothetical protein
MIAGLRLAAHARRPIEKSPRARRAGPQEGTQGKTSPPHGTPEEFRGTFENGVASERRAPI